MAIQFVSIIDITSFLGLSVLENFNSIWGLIVYQDVHLEAKNVVSYL